MFQVRSFYQAPNRRPRRDFFCLPRLRRRATITPVSPPDFLFPFYYLTLSQSITTHTLSARTNLLLAPMQCTDNALPNTFDADSALYASQLAMGLAYQEDVGMRLMKAEIIVKSNVDWSQGVSNIGDAWPGTSNIAFAQTRGRNYEELVIVNRGTILKDVEDATRNFAGQVRTDNIFVGKRSGDKINRQYAQLMVHGAYLDRAMGPPQLLPLLRAALPTRPHALRFPRGQASSSHTSSSMR